MWTDPGFKHLNALERKNEVHEVLRYAGKRNCD